MITELGSRSVFISGAARGIGRATAELFLSRGWRVGMYDVDTAAVTEAAAGRARAVPGTLDVRDAGQWRVALGDFCGTGGLDVLINNAGVLASGPFVGMTAEEHRRMVDINVIGVVNGALEGYPFLERSHGLLLNLCSASSLYGQPTLATYGATKSAVKSLTEALDIEWQAAGVRVRSLLPLFVATDMVSRDGRGAASVGRLGVRLTPEDVAATAWKVAHERRRRLAGPHRPVGRQTRLMAAAAAVTPDWANRLVVSRLAR
jgi:NAD(P)-dependent dehydrogenase (short-subunit alcohol dehydrogenase family)